MSNIADVLSIKAIGRIIRATAQFRHGKGHNPSFISIPFTWWEWILECSDLLPEVELLRLSKTNVLLYQNAILYPSKTQNDVEVLI